MSVVSEQPIGVILAGGSGRRLGGDKAMVALAGRPLIEYPLQAMRAALAEVAVVAKPETQLPELAGVQIWREPAEPRHPVMGIVHALGKSGDRPVMVCAVDMPFVTASVLGAIAQADAVAAPAVIAALPDGLQPQLGRYEPLSRMLLGFAAAEADRPLREIVAELGPRRFELHDPRTAFNINTREDLAEAERLLSAA